MTVYGVMRVLQVLSYRAVWPEVLGLRPILIVVVRDPQGKFKDTYLFTTDVTRGVSWVVETFARRWSIEVLFKASKQVLEIEGPHHWCQESIEKLAPWVWLLQSVVGVWYLTVGRTLPEAELARRDLGGVGHGVVVEPLGARVPDGHDVRQPGNSPDSDETNDPAELIERMKNYLFYVASAA